MDATEVKSIVTTEVRALMNQALEFVGTIVEVKPKTDAEYQNAVELCRVCKKHINDLESARKDQVKPLNDEVKAINGEYSTVTTRLLNGETVLKRAMSVYAQEQERKRIEEQRKRDAEAAEARRKAEEAARKEAEKAEAYRQQGRDDMAEKADARVEAHIDRAVNTVAVEVESTAKAAGASYRKDYVFTIVDKRAAILHCIDNPMFADHVALDVKALEKIAKASKGKLVIPGITVRETLTPIVRV